MTAGAQPGRRLLVALTGGVVLMLAAHASGDGVQAASNTLGPLLVAEDGTAYAAIIIDEQASPLEQLAASELQTYIEKATGVRLPVGSEAPRGAHRLVIGQTRAAQDGQWRPVRTAAPHPFSEDAFRIRRAGDALYIAGNGPRGTLYGVYEFLEQFVGVRWFEPGPLGEYVPRLKRLAIDDIDLAIEPAFEFRAFNLTNQLWSPDETVTWARRNRINVLRDSDAGGIPWPGGHAYYRYLPPERYFQAHPEYYAEVAGVRRSSGAQIETANPEAVQVFAANVAQALREDPRPLISISPNDGYGWSESAEARALDVHLGAPEGRVSERVFHFANQVAELVGDEFPDTRFLSFAYVNYIAPPEGVDVSPRVIPWVAHYLPACYTHPIADPNDPANSEFRAYLESWVQTADTVYTYNYTNKWPGWMNLLRPVERVMAADVLYQHEIGVKGYYGQSYGGNWAVIGPTIYVTARLLWNVDLDPDSVLEEYFRFIYGDASEAMLAYHERLQNLWESAPVHANSDPAKTAPLIFTEEALDTLRAHLAHARAAARTQAVRERIRRQEVLVDYTSDYVKLVRAMNAGTDVATVDAGWAIVQDIVATAIREAGASIFHDGFLDIFWRDYGAPMKAAHDRVHAEATPVSIPYATDFSEVDELSAHWTTSGEWHREGGVLVGRAGQAYLEADMPTADYTVEARVRVSPGGFAGVFVRAASREDFDFVLFDLMDRFQAARLSVGQGQVQRHALAVVPGQWYSLRLEVRGGVATAYVNGSLAGRVELAEAYQEAGLVGLRVRGPDASAFDDFHIEPIGPLKAAN